MPTEGDANATNETDKAVTPGLNDPENREIRTDESTLSSSQPKRGSNPASSRDELRDLMRQFTSQRKSMMSKRKINTVSAVLETLIKVHGWDEVLERMLALAKQAHSNANDDVEFHEGEIDVFTEEMELSPDERFSTIPQLKKQVREEERELDDAHCRCDRMEEIVSALEEVV